MRHTLIFLFVFLNISLYAQDIRNVSWGATKAEVKKAEKTKLFNETGDDLLYEATLSNTKFYISYEFIDNQLHRVTYIENEDYINSNNYVDDFDKFSKILTEKYGEPTSSKVDWSDDLYKDRYNDRGMAVSAGHVTYKAFWENDKTDVALICTGENFKVSFGIVYTSKKYKQIVSELQKEKRKSDF